MQIYFCEKCGRRTSDVEIDRGEGTLVDGLAWCKACREFAPAPAAPAVTPHPGPKRPPSSTRRPPAGPPARQANTTFIFAVVGGVAAGLVAGLLVFLSRRTEAPAPHPPAKAARSPAQPEPGPAPVARPAPAPGPTPVSRTGPAPRPEPAPAQQPGPAPDAVHEELFVSISSPSQGSLFKPGSDVTVGVMLMGGDGGVKGVEVLAGGKVVGRIAGAERSFAWRSVGEGTYDLVARATDGSGETAESAPVRVNVAPSRPVAGFFVEAESGRQNMETKQSADASGGALVQGNSTGRELTVDIAVGEAVAGAQVAIRNVGWGSQNGQLEVSFGPSSGGVSRLGRIDCRGGMKWKLLSVGRDLQPGDYRVKLRVPSERAGGAFDVIGIVPGGTKIPNRLTGGVLDEAGTIVSVGMSLNLGSAGGGAAGGARAAARAPRPSNEQAVFSSLAKAYDADRVTPKRIAAVGGPVAASSNFEKSLMRELTKADGYAFSPKLGLAGSSGTTSRLKSGIERRLDKERPEVVRVCFDLKELADHRKLEERQSDLRFVVEKVLERGAVPVLFTLPVARTGHQATDDLVADHNLMVGRLANSLRVPYIDAYAILNADETKLAEYCTRSGLRPAGFDLLNAKFLELYRTLEEKVLARGPAEGAAKPGPAGGRKEPGEPEEPEPAGGAGPAKDSLLTNGGFELVAGRAARGWEKWSEGPGRYSLRFDRMNVRSGERAAEVRVFADGVKAGLQQRLRLEAGAYEARFWACADVGRAASAHVSLDAEDGPPVSVTDKWTRFTRTFEVGKPEPGARLRLWAAKKDVRVWFDDVELLPVGR